MKLRTFTGLDKETECACGCHQKLLARPDVQVVVDMDSPKWKRDRYLPGHAGNGYGSSPYAQRAKKEAPPSQAPAPTPPAPASPPAPTHDPAPNVAVSVVKTGEERAWSLLQVTYNLGSFESVKAGVADYARDGEDAQALAQRVAELVHSELEAQVQALRNLHARVEASTEGVSA